jgi:hypothetical protein
LHIAYTWSHAIDNQSDPLIGDFFDLSFAGTSAGTGRTGLAAFARQFDSRVDRGNSDFDQRHNLALYSIWSLPSLPRSSRWRAIASGWKLSQMAAFRSGFPFSVTAPPGLEELGTPIGEPIYNNRADVIGSGRAQRRLEDAPGGKVLFNADAFTRPEIGRLGNSGRNAFRGPGFFNIDLSLSRSFPVRGLGEAGRLTLRADGFNFLNHANLGNPVAACLPTFPLTRQCLPHTNFGYAAYGRSERNPDFPALIPLSDAARQIQLLVRIEF